MRPTVLLTSMMLFPALLGAQSNPLVGNWDLNLPAGMRIENGEPTPVMAKATLTIKVEGDSLIGMLKTEPPEGMEARPASRLATKLVAGSATFVVRGKATMNMNGEESSHTSISTYVLTATGDELKGTVTREIEGMEMAMAGAQALTGKRVK